MAQPDWSSDSHSLAFEADVAADGFRIYLILNAYWEPLTFELPPVGDDRATAWRRWIDTSLGSPLDIVPWQTAPELSAQRYTAAARSVVALFAELRPR
jgi:isoamylase